MPFIGDIAAGLGSGVHHTFFADDLQIYIQGTVAEIWSVLQLLSEGACRVADWAAENGLLLNVAKTKAITFGTSYYVNRLNELGINSVSARGSGVEVVFSVKSLVVFLDSTMN